MSTNGNAAAMVRVSWSSLSSMVAFTMLLALSLVPAAHAAEGSLDPTWGGIGKVATPFGLFAHGNAVAIQSDQKVVVAGEENGNFAILRYNADGTLDTSFGPSGTGKVSTLFGADERAFAVAISPTSGKIAVAGSSGSDLALAVYTSNGSLDTAFNPGASGILLPGMVLTSISNKQDVGRGVAFQQDEKIVVAGYSEDPNNTGTDDNFDFLVVRYNTNGSLDTTFNGTGHVTTDFGGGQRRDKGYAVAIQSDGKILVAGESKLNFALARYTSGGVLDTTFGGTTNSDSQGTVTTDFGHDDAAYALAIVSGGRIVLAGEADVVGLPNCPAANPPAIINGHICQYFDFALARYTNNGVLDQSFGTQGKVTTPIFETNHDDQGRGIAIQPADGKIVVAGATDTSVHTYDPDGNETGGPLMYDFALVRYTSEGVVDTTFGNNGKVMTNFGSPNSVNANGVAIQSNGKIVVAGFAMSGTNNTFAVARYDVTPPVEIAKVSNNPYGTLTLVNGTLIGNIITELKPNAVIQLGTTAGSPGSFAEIDFHGFNVVAGDTLTVKSGAAGQTLRIVNDNSSATNIAGNLKTEGGNGAKAPGLFVKNQNGITVAQGGSINSAEGLTVNALGATSKEGQPLVNGGTLDGGSSLQLFGAKINGGGSFKGDAILISTFGNANNPGNPNFLFNGLQLFPSTTASATVQLNGYGSSPQTFNVKVNGNAMVAMPSAWPAGSTLLPNNLPVAPGGAVAPGTPLPSYGGGSMIVQAAGSLGLINTGTNNYVFPGAIVLKSTGTLDVAGVTVNNSWTGAGQAFQGVFFESPNIINSTVAPFQVLTNNLNWVNFSTLPHFSVTAFTLQPDGGGLSQKNADSIAPHLNTFSIEITAAAAGQCWTCLVNTGPVNMK